MDLDSARIRVEQLREKPDFPFAPLEGVGAEPGGLGGHRDLPAAAGVRGGNGRSVGLPAPLGVHGPCARLHRTFSHALPVGAGHDHGQPPSHGGAGAGRTSRPDAMRRSCSSSWAARTTFWARTSPGHQPA